MSEDKQCDGCYWRRPDWRDGGWCYMFEERFEGCAQRTDPRDLNERDRENDLPFAQEIGDGDTRMTGTTDEADA